MPKPVQTIAVLLQSTVKNDYRVIKTIHTLSREFVVHLFYVNGNVEEDQKLFPESVSLFPVKVRVSAFQKFLRHSFFCFEFNFFYKTVLSKKVQYNYVWANDLPTLYPTMQIAKRLGAKAIYDSHEIYVETINQFFHRNPSGIKKPIFSLLIALMRLHGKQVEKKWIPHLYGFVTVNRSLLEHFAKTYSLPQRRRVIMNLPHSQTSTDPRVDFRQIFGWEESDRILLYQGMLNEGRGLFLLLETLPTLAESVKLVLLGNGPLKPLLENLVQKKDLSSRVRFLAAVPLPLLPPYTQGADVGINLLESFNLSKQLASPNKLFEYIHAGIPVVASDSVENRLVFEKYPLGGLTQNTVSALAETIVEVLKLPLGTIKQVSMAAKKEYNWENQEEALLSLFSPIHD